jgi:hypothetical protein
VLFDRKQFCFVHRASIPIFFGCSHSLGQRHAFRDQFVDNRLPLRRGYIYPSFVNQEIVLPLSVHAKEWKVMTFEKRSSTNEKWKRRFQQSGNVPAIWSRWWLKVFPASDSFSE